jgi:hypothetical protein
MFPDVLCFLPSLHFCSCPLSSEFIKTQSHSSGQHLCTLLLDDGECHLQERLLSTKTMSLNVAPDNYLPSRPRVTQHYLEQLPVIWHRLHCAMPSVDILYNYTYSTDYHHQLQNSSYYFQITPSVSIIFEWPKYFRDILCVNYLFYILSIQFCIHWINLYCFHFLQHVSAIHAIIR